jgi:multisubunit Na+/H+ antiporter MnhC subunit
VPEQPVDAGETSATRQDAGPRRHHELMQAPSRVVVRVDVVPAVTVFVVVALTGVPLGYLWSRLAPPRQSTVANGTPVPLLATIYHSFDPVAVFLLIGLGAGLLVGVALWMLLRRRRGPWIVLMGVLGSLVAAWLAIRLGGGFAAATYPIPHVLRTGMPVAVPPRVDTLWAVVAQPLGVALAYGLAATWNGLDDLGTGKPAE